MTWPKSVARELINQEQRCNEFLRQILKQHTALSQSKSKTHRLAELCTQVVPGKRKSEAWAARYEKFLRSPVWKLVSDETLRKAHFKCQYLGCKEHAMQAFLLEFPEEHLDLNFDWMKRDDILMALCSRHHGMMHGFIMKTVIPSNCQLTQSNTDLVPGGGIPAVCVSAAQRPGFAAWQST